MTDSADRFRARGPAARPLGTETIRPWTDALAASRAPLLELVEACFPGTWSPSSIEVSLGEGAESPSRAWVALGSDSSVHGFLFARRILDGVEIDLIGVAAAHRRSGCGGRMLARLIEAERRGGAARVQLEIRRSNEAARQLYAAHGFVVAGERSRYYPGGEDALLMHLDLR